VSRATVQLAKRTMEDLRFAHVLLLGAGEAAKLAGRAMAEAGVAQIVVANRTLQRAIELAAELGALAAPLEDLEGLVGEADIIIGATGSPGYILTPELVARANRDPSRSLLAIDIAVPQDIDPRIKAMPGVALFDIDDLELIAEVNRRSRQQAACQVEALVTAEVQRFAEWLSSREVTPTVAAIQERAESIRKRELARLLKVSRQLTSEEQERVEAFSRAMLKKLLHPAMASLKGRRDPSYAQAARGLFGLDDAEGSRE
ncbi:MAG: glutamyl-tRNA reductase, partial [Chloroflexi bacterium]|nr:glutamyl-tRNA reductase [Chloroflexota bacterium]